MRFVIKKITQWRNRLSDAFELPERYKGTILEKWMFYWRGLFNDYTEVATNVVIESYTKPKQALGYVGMTYVFYQLVIRNPDEEQLVRLLRHYSNLMVTVAPHMHNPISADYLCKLERAVNRKQVRVVSLIFCSLLWIDLHDKDDCTYPAICEYTTVGIWDFHTHVIDFGFWDHFWRLKWKMRNYDINYL